MGRPILLLPAILIVLIIFYLWKRPKPLSAKHQLENRNQPTNQQHKLFKRLGQNGCVIKSMPTNS